MAVAKEKKKEIVNQYQLHKNDTGSPEVQLAVLTNRINELTKHLSNNPKDCHSQRGLLMMVSKRKSILGYLQKNNIESYRRIIDQLSIRG